MSQGTSGKLVELKNSLHHLPTGSKALRRTNGHQWLEVTVGVRRSKPLPDLSGLDNVLPLDRKYLNRDQIAKQFGSDPAAITAITKFAKLNGLIVTHNETASARLGLAGTVDAMSKAFGVTLFDYENAQLAESHPRKDTTFHARTGGIYLPQDVAGAITGVFGFNNHPVLRRARQTLARPSDINAPAKNWFVPTELAQVYNFPAQTASDQCIGLFEFGGGVETADVKSYFEKIKAVAPQVTVVSVNNTPTDPASDPETTGEVMLDVDVAGALATGAKVAVYFSSFDEKGLIDCLSTLIADSKNDPSVVSISYGWAEIQPFNNDGILWSSSAIDHCNDSFLAACHLGITICVSTGDDGSEAQVKDGRAHINFPASSPYVLAVGGTSLHVRKDVDGLNQVSEVVWNNGPGSGTGGGISDTTPAPVWQAGIQRSINPGNFAGRGIPDVAANADPNTGYLTMSGGSLQIVGGTSASAPLWASLITLINSKLSGRVGNFNALLYSKFGPAGVLRDITVGNNDTDGLLAGQFAAGPGWDPCSGWGVPDGEKLLLALKG